LAQITNQNVARLQLVASVKLPAGAGHGMLPKIAGDTLFVLSPFPQTLSALNAFGDAVGSLKWRYSSHADPAAASLRSSGPGAAAPALSENAAYINTSDGHTIAVDTASGLVRWDWKTADLSVGETLGSAPLVVGNAVVVGNAGDDFGARGWMMARDRDSGKELWRKYSTGSDTDVGIGESFHPFYHADRGTDLGIGSWPPDAWQHGGGSVSGRLLYDPGLDLIVHGTGHPAPGNPEQRPGDNRWTSGIFARDSATGMARWFTALTPHDQYALGATNANLLVDREWHGTKRQLLVQANANGFVYVLDRRTGEILSAESFIPVNAVTAIDMRTGTPRQNEAKSLHGASPVRDVCPAAPGANLGAPAYSEQSGLLFIPAILLCMDMRAQPVSYIKSTPYDGLTRRLKPMPDSPRGAMIAWDIEKAERAWTISEEFPLEGGVLATDGDLVFYGTLDGWFRAADSRNGHILWEYRTTSQIAGQPISYTGPDSRQYVAVLAGPSGGIGAVSDRDIDRRDLTARNGSANAIADFPSPVEPGGRLYIFSLP
jgi:PQQ-dependent dehydrogenase (methanol/ethanol family)